MHHQLASKSGSRFSWLALLFGAASALTSQACSVDKSKFTFNDDEFNNASNGGGANPNGGGANPNGGGANPNGGGANPNGGNGGDSGSSSDAGAAGTDMGPPSDCTVGEHYCSPDGHLQTCKAGTPPAFDSGTACMDADHCSETQGKCLKCAPGEFQCVNAILQQCNIFGSAFEDSAICDSKAACVANGQKGFCARCKPASAVCESALIAPSIADNSPVLTTNRLLNCNVDGSGTDTQQVCESDAEACSATTKSCTKCKPNSFVCDGNTLNTCNADGMDYTFKQTCNSGKLCDAVNGKCTPPPDGCTVGMYKCNGDRLQACDDNGAFVTIDNCGAGLCDQNQGRCKGCANNATACNGNTMQSCDGYTGQFFTSESCVANCTVTAGVASCGGGCKAGTIVCYEGSNAYTLCGAGGTQSFNNCPTGQVCNPAAVTNGAAPSCVSCTPGQYNCDMNGNLTKCGADGSGSTLVENCRLTNKSCNQFLGACLPAAPGQYACSATGDLQQLLYSADHLTTTPAPLESGDSCGGANMCQQYQTACRRPQCLVGVPTCQGGDVYGCDTGDQRRRTGVHCATTSRCQDGFGCVKPLAIAAGDAHTCAIVAGLTAADGDAGTVMCWGANESGQLGNGSALLTDSKEARPVVVTQNDKNGGNTTMEQLFVRPFFTGLCAGKNFTCADLNAEQPSVACWGSNLNGQLGVNSPDPGPYNSPFDTVQAPGQVSEKGLYLTNATCGAEFACALGPDGGAWCWGANDAGQLGNGSIGTPGIGAARVDGHLFTQISAGARHVCGVQADNTVWCWGNGAQGQLGTGDTKGSAMPVMVGMLTAPGDRPLALGNDFTLALGTKDSKSPSSWGGNLFGQLGNGTNGDAPSPGPLSGLTTATVGLTGTLYSGSTAEHACVSIGDSLQCWGANVFGELGNNSTGDSNNPILILDGKADTTKVAPGAHSVAVGGRHTCAITVKGDVMCWGANHRSQLGSALPTPQRIPVRAY